MSTAAEPTPRCVGIALGEDEREEFTAAVSAAIASSGLDLELKPDASPGEIDYLVYNVDSGVSEFAPYTKLRAILNTWAGVEAVIGRITWPEHVPFCRMVEPGMTIGMVEYFVGHALRYHLDIDRWVRLSAEGTWQKWSPPLARDRTVGVLGLGALGAATAEALVDLNFRVVGWSRSPKTIAGVTCHHGDAGLSTTLANAEILVVILPLTADTREILNAERFAMMPSGACVINAGRGPLIDDDALLDALGSGQLRHATLDVFREEPLPKEHPFWRHSQVTVTPHIASITRPATAAAAILEQIRRDMNGAPLLHVVDRDRGY